MKILGNSMRGLNPQQKQLLYRSCTLPIALYSFQMWFYNKAPLSYPLKTVGKLQRRAALWILGAFKTFLLLGIEAIAGLLPINLHLQKLSGRSQLQANSLLLNHILHSLMENKSNMLSQQHSLSKCQYELIKNHLVDMDNCFNEVFSLFDPLNPEISLGSKIIDIFSNHFSFHFFSKHKDQNFKS